MEKLKFELKPDQKNAGDEPYIELNKVLKILQVAQTGGHANLLITSGEIVVNEEVEYRKRKKLRKGDFIEAPGAEIAIV
ncbi:RNA-binding S4 domain-containing protein [Crocinitomicaceae bacterium]|jgi:ribosome-associated protein|nr:RNA-binding S4 domain-containing protein [Crocinitomicaceae bacterium]